MNRAYGVLSFKAFDDDQRIIEGLATTVKTDRMDDVVEPRGAVFNLPLPLLMQHAAVPEESVGHVIDATVTNDGIRIRAKIERDPLLPELDKAWARIKKGLVRGLSIGFRPLQAEPIDAKNPFSGTRYKAWEWLELSAVVVPANQEASISVVKSLAQVRVARCQGRAAAIEKPVERCDDLCADPADLDRNAAIWLA
jgi:HK97 family phage prohead protease